jgi:hypothetical protein
MFIMASMFTTLQAQSEFARNGKDIPMYIGNDTIIIYDGIIRIQNDSITFVETVAGFYINEHCNDIHIIAKEHYVNTRGNYVMYQSPGEYQFWIKINPTTGKITMFHYTSFHNYKTIEECSTYSPR